VAACVRSLNDGKENICISEEKRSDIFNLEGSTKILDQILNERLRQKRQT
jgi:hypothetical protein